MFGGFEPKINTWQSKPIDITFNDDGIFYANKTPCVYYLSPKSEEIVSLHADLQKHMGVDMPVDQHQFVPHCTLFYIKDWTIVEPHFNALRIITQEYINTHKHTAHNASAHLYATNSRITPHLQIPIHAF